MTMRYELYVISGPFFVRRKKSEALCLFGEGIVRSRLKADLRQVNDTDDFRACCKKHKIRSVGLVAISMLPKLREELDLIRHKVDTARSHFVVLLKYQDPNVQIYQQSPPSENFFLISTEKFLLFLGDRRSTLKLCYNLMLSALAIENGGVDQMMVHQIGHPDKSMAKTKMKSAPAEVVIPHRGDLDGLDTALSYLDDQIAGPNKISVCFDEAVTNRHFDLVGKHPSTDFYLNYPAPVGPYPSRDILARSSSREVIIFHDSDDISTSDRTDRLVNHLLTHNMDAVGSHELRIDKLKGKIIAVRYPLKVIESGRTGANPTIFFPTTAILKEAFIRNGGLSTVRKHSSDTQFYKRAYFLLNMENVDDFLYIRVKRENSLTPAKSTALGTPVRERLGLQWTKDFIKVKHQNINLLESTLIDERVNGATRVVSLSLDQQEKILRWQALCAELITDRLVDCEEPGFPEPKDVLQNRILEYQSIEDYSARILKQTISWRIGKLITTSIKALLFWVPFIKRR